MIFMKGWEWALLQCMLWVLFWTHTRYCCHASTCIACLLSILILYMAVFLTIIMSIDQPKDTVHGLLCLQKFGDFLPFSYQLVAGCSNHEPRMWFVHCWVVCSSLREATTTLSNPPQTQKISLIAKCFIWQRYTRYVQVH